MALLGAVVSVLAFPPYGPGWLIVGGVGLFLASLRMAESPRMGMLLGSVYGLVFFGGLMWWLIRLELIALILVPVQAAFLAAYGWWLGRHHQRSPAAWLGLAVGGWALLELVRYHFPVGGLEWGAVGYALSDQAWARAGARIVGTSGWTVLVVAVAGIGALAWSGAWRRWMLGILSLPVLVVAAAWVPAQFVQYDFGAPYRVAIVQGSTPCPFEHCSPNERLRTFEQHLELTKTIEPGSADLVVWSEGSTGSTNADPVQNPEIGTAISEQARRIGTWVLVGSDRPISDAEWVNTNVVFDPDGEIVGEYRKQHPVPFGEYVPLRPVFGLIPATRRVPRDMVPGDGPVVFDLVDYALGSVISFEGGFSRYARAHVGEGAHVMVVATNEGSYGIAPTADQFIGMTRMRAAENQRPLIHAAVTGRSVVIDHEGEIVSELSGLGTREIIRGEFQPRGTTTWFTRLGDWVMWLSAVGAVVLWWRIRTLVGSTAVSTEKGIIDDAGA